MGEVFDRSKVVLFFSLSFVIVILGLINRADIFVMLLSIELILSILFCMERIDRRIIFLMYVVSFYLFLVGKPILEELFKYPSDKPFPETIDHKAYIIIFLGFTSLLLTYCILESNKITFSLDNRAVYTDIISTDDIYAYNPYLSIRKWSKYIYLITFAAYILILFDRISFVNAYGYTESYISYKVSLPYPIRLMGELCPYSLALFMAAMPTKKEFRIVFILQMLYYFLSLMTGRRMYFMTGILFMITYFVIRNSVPRNEGKWLDKRHLLFLLLLAPVILIYMLLVQYTRVEETYSGSFIEAIFEFFYRQGYSVNIIKMAVEDNKWLNNHPYMLYDTLKYLRTNFITKLFIKDNFNFEYVNAVSTALNSNSLAHAFSYEVYPHAYLYGYGVGSSYVAEAYVDLGYPGVVLSNIIYGCFIYFISTIRKSSIIFSTTVFMLLDKLYVSPRYNFDRVFISVIDPSYLMFIAFILILQRIYTEQNIST